MKPYYQDDWVTLYHGDCLEIMPLLDLKVDMILCDLPYGTTACSWDTIIPFKPLWENYDRLIRDNGAVVLTASQPFTTDLINSNRKKFKYEWIWDKYWCGNPYAAKYGPLKIHENIVVFGGKKAQYFPQKNILKKVETQLRDRRKVGVIKRESESFGKINKVQCEDIYKTPETILKYKSERGGNQFISSGRHPNQKPVPLFTYLIKTYTLPDETVLDNCVGSGTTMLACKESGRKCIAIEKEEKYCEIAAKRCGQEVLDFGGNF